MGYFDKNKYYSYLMELKEEYENMIKDIYAIKEPSEDNIQHTLMYSKLITIIEKEMKDNE